MDKKLPSALIILSIFILAMKDSASFIHILLHYIPNNPLHNHVAIIKKQKINAFEIHTYLHHKHTSHEHSHGHVHDIMDHIHSNDSSEKEAQSERIEHSVKIDLFIHTYKNFIIEKNSTLILITANSTHYFSIIDRSPFPLFHPPQV